MEITITFGAWLIPTAITVITIAWATFYDDGGGYLGGLGNFLMLVPALFISMIAWIIYAACK